MDSLQSESEQVRFAGQADLQCQHVLLAVLAAQQPFANFNAGASRLLPRPALPHLHHTALLPGTFVQAKSLREIRSRDPAFDMVTFLRNMKHDVRTLIKVGCTTCGCFAVRCCLHRRCCHRQRCLHRRCRCPAAVLLLPPPPLRPQRRALLPLRQALPLSPTPLMLPRRCAAPLNMRVC